MKRGYIIAHRYSRLNPIITLWGALRRGKNKAKNVAKIGREVKNICSLNARKQKNFLTK